MTKRIISYLLVALMLLTLVPVGASAAYEEDEIRGSSAEFVLADSLSVSLPENPSFSVYSRGTYSECYGNQLDGLAKMLYDGMTEYYVTEKNTGDYYHSLKGYFSWVYGDDAAKAEVMEEIKVAVQVAMDAFLYDHPEIFWLRIVSYAYSTAFFKDKETGLLVGGIDNLALKPKEIYTDAKLNIEAFDNAVDEAVEEITASVSDVTDRYELLRATHDYICNNAWYNYASTSIVHTAEPIFIGDGGVVCEGYAKAFKIICDELGIPCALVSGEANGGAHMWNYVQMDDGKWYLVDATWDDQENEIYDTYFLANANTVGFLDVAISEERTAYGDFSSTGYINFIYPELSSTAFVKHTHEWDSEYTVDENATCTESGSKSIHCKSCDEKKGVTEIPALGHDFVNYTSDNNATCSADGTKTAKCERCDETDTITDEGSKVEHDWNNWASISAPTCKTGGVEKRTCKNCTASETRNVGATNHENAYLTDKVAPDCTEVGYEAGLYCPDCKVWISGHDEISSLGHEFKTYTADNNATCTADGTKTAKCERCDETDTITDEGSKVEHDWNNWASISAPTCTTGGVEKRTCKNCTASETRNVGATNHANAYLTDKVAPTCTEVGYEAGLYCPDCKIWISGHDEIASLGHEFKAYTSDNNATCSADGTKTAKCERCDETDTITDEGSMVEHDWSEWIVEINSTCTKNGAEVRSCATCKVSERKIINATNHPDAYATEAVESSCSAAGYTEGLYCPECENWVSGHAEIKKLPHKFTEKIIDADHLVSAATVIDLAVYGYDCADCDEISSTETFTHGDRLPLGRTKKITASSGSSTINLSWTAVDYAIGYKVYQKVTGGWKSLKNVTSTSAKIEKLSAGTKYTFAVIAATRINGKVVWAKNFTTVSTATQAPLPTTIKTKQSTSAIQFTWNSCKGATGYRIYVLEGEEWNYLGQVKGTKATIKNLKAGKKYTYAIRPYISVDGGSVVWSAYKTYTAATKPAVPVTTVTSAAKGKITVKWKAVNGAEAYQLYYKTANGSYKLYNNYTGAKTVNFSNLKSGVKYTFAVRAAIKTSGGWIFGAYTPVNVTVK